MSQISCDSQLSNVCKSSSAILADGLLLFPLSMQKKEPVSTLTGSVIWHVLGHRHDQLARVFEVFVPTCTYSNIHFLKGSRSLRWQVFMLVVNNICRQEFTASLSERLQRFSQLSGMIRRERLLPPTWLQLL